MSALELKVPPVVQVALLALAMLGLARAFPQWQLPFPGARWLGLAAGTAGAVLALSGVRAFRRAGTTVDPRAPGAAASLVVGGVYRVSRNPMYLGFAMLLAGWALWLAHPLAWLLLPVFVVYMNRYQIAPEERVLRRRFGRAWEDWAARVRRWI